MGYALFANRKIFYTNLVYTLQMQLDRIAQERLENMNYCSAICDGEVTQDEILGDLGNRDRYSEFNAGLLMYQNSTPFSMQVEGEDGKVSSIDIGTYMYGPNATPEQKIAAEMAWKQSQAEKYAKNIERQLEAYDNQLEMKQKRIETQLTAAQNQLKAVEEAEANAIQSATPKYAGLG